MDEHWAAAGARGTIARLPRAKRAFRIALAGGVHVEIDGRRAPDAALGGRRPRLAFAVLAAEHGRDVSREELALALWGEQLPRTWAPSLREVVSKVRRYLDAVGLAEARVTSAFGCYRLDLPAGAEVDVEMAEEGAEEAARLLAAGDLPAAHALATRVQAIASQPLLAGEQGQWLEGRRRLLEDCLACALHVLAAVAEERRDWAAVIHAQEALVARQPFREDAYDSLMRAHAAAGNRAQAIRVYHRCRLLLDEELAIRPSPQMEARFLSLLYEPESNERRAAVASAG
jgi:DNA-binding SARP family transcriptional activator